MKSNENAPSVESALKIVRDELSPAKRWVYRGLLVVICAWIAALVSMWMTEPKALPMRLHVAFAGLTLIGTGWIGVLTWILTRQNCPTALDRIATGWMATFACSISLVMSVAIAVMRNNLWAAAALAILGTVLLVAAILVLRSGYLLKRRILASLNSMKKGSSVMVGLIAGLTFPGAAAPFALADEKLKIEPARIETRSGSVVEAESGRLTVPLFHTQPDGPQIDIAFIRVPGKSDSTAPPLFILAGGPGDSGIGVVRGMFGDGGKMVRNYIDGDIIGIDQRGVGEARPNLEVPDRYGFPIPEPGSLAAYTSRITQTHRMVATRLREAGIDLKAINTNENADDINALRQALGYEKIRLWGTSYGSHLALALIKRNEKHIDRAFIVSPEGPDHTLKNPVYVQNCLERIAGTNRELWPTFEKILKKLDEAPVQASVIHPISKQPVKIGVSAFDVRLWAWNSMDRIETTRQFAAAVRQMEEGDFSAPGLWLLRYRAMSGVGSAMKHAMDAASGCSPGRHQQIDQGVDKCILGDVINYQVAEASAAWNVSSLPDEFREPVHSDIPLLVFCGDLDPRTSLENAREILEGFRNGRLVIIEGGGHGFRPSPELLSIVGEFFRGNRVVSVHAPIKCFAHFQGVRPIFRFAQKCMIPCF